MPLKELFTSCVDTFSNLDSEGFNNNNSSTGSLVTSFVLLVLWLVILALVGKFLWNNAAVPLVPVLRRATSIWQILGLWVLTQLLFE